MKFKDMISDLRSKDIRKHDEVMVVEAQSERLGKPKQRKDMVTLINQWPERKGER